MPRTNCPVTPRRDASKQGAGDVLGNLHTQPSRKGEGMRAETFLQVLTPTHTHPFCKEVGSCTKADAGPWNTPAGSHLSLLLLDVTWPALP